MVIITDTFYSNVRGRVTECVSKWVYLSVSLSVCVCVCVCGGGGGGVVSGIVSVG